MDRDEAIAILRKEYLCVDRDCDIERNCGKCDLVMPSKEPILEAFKMAIKALEQEPKWERLYSWLNDMRLGIAPDETVTDIDERNARIAQTDILDEIMEHLPAVTTQPCEDCISRTQAIEAVKAIKFGLWEIDIPSPTAPEYREHHEQVTELMGVCDCWIKKLTEYQSVQPKAGQWIACSDRLPEEGTYLICTYDGYISTIRYSSDMGWLLSSIIIAWMPLPAPFEPQERSSEA